jgi:hypothetical protein
VPLRLLARAAPFVLGAVAAGLWLRRRHVERPALRERTGEVPPAPPSRPPAPHTRSAAPPTRPSGRFQRPVAARFARAAARRPIDIVTIVDDLLGTAR